MSTFDTSFETYAWPRLAERFGVSADYAPPGEGAGASAQGVTVLLERRGSRLEERGQTTRRVHDGQLEVATADVALPEIGGRFTIGTEGWTVTGPPESEAGHWRCPVEWVELHAHGEWRPDSG